MNTVCKFVIIFFLLFILPSFACAGWSTAQNLLSGKWGGAPGEFSFSEGDTSASFPREFGVDLFGRVYIDDELNSRVQIFDNDGILKKIISSPSDVDQSLGWPYTISVNQEGAFVANYDGSKKYFFDINWNLAAKLTINGEATAIANGYIFKIGKLQYNFYSKDGVFVREFSGKPFSVGKILSVNQNSNDEYLYAIEYDNYTYNIVSERPLEYYKQDINGYLYSVIKTPLVGSMVYSVKKYSKCGVSLGQLNLPANEIESSPEPSQIPLEINIYVVSEYGPPLVGPDGNVYAWKRTQDRYSILKWTWVDSPDDPKGGPDAPTDLKVTPATTGLSVTWTASPQDPGCVEGYEVERSSISGGIFSNITTTAPGVVSYSDTGVLPGSSAFYRVRAKSSCGPSDYTAVIGGTRP